MDEQEDRPRKAQLPTDLDKLLARLELQEQIIQEQKLELAAKKESGETRAGVESSISHRDGEQTGISSAQNSLGSHEYPHLFDNRVKNFGAHPESPGNRAPFFEAGDDDFIQEQINKHTFAQAVDSDFYTDGVPYTMPIDQSGNPSQFTLPRGANYSGAPMWNDQKPKSYFSGHGPQFDSSSYWQMTPSQTHQSRPAVDQEPTQDWKVISPDIRRGVSIHSPPSSLQGTPGRHCFSPSPLSPPFVPTNTSSWNSAGQTTPSSSLNSHPGYGTVPYNSSYTQPGHTDYSPGFRVNTGNWHKPTSTSPTQPLGANLYGNSSESPNWKRLMERGVPCDWGYLVDRVVTQNDQGASVFLQHKLKDLDHPEHKIEIVNAIVEKALPLMTNRFGNFLVQRCFEYGEPYHVEAIMKLIKGRVVQLSMDAFGCHVIQRALDTVPEPFKVLMIQELLHRIPETVMHRYACHVWQKLFEVRWVGTPPLIMKHMNEALAGMWPEIAMGETGSLVVQNIFENCLEEDKRPCVDEILANLDMIARGQFGNWCIQHICEHGAPRDQSLALDMVLHSVVEYSMDQYASKVVEKCLKSSIAPGFLDRYLERVCEGRADRPRLPIIDIASDQYGNYLIQLILGTAPMHQREFVANHIRKHMVSLRANRLQTPTVQECMVVTMATTVVCTRAVAIEINGKVIAKLFFS
ncbi:hypothetical protein H072_783 [Dactylellina haptotyla CBS 200.50]|uniref:PUM-HD domain-containing protein n=1 Tax=Dactylellina haptotyla (strain CBS 200.50) TaxID=1284197 RepID=S8CBU8_DACHA|nr:hypothetical protein H072_783 [Dactylellina haptotyla CBS 200.50]